MRKPKMLEDLFLDGLKDIYFAEKKILVALPKMAKAAGSNELRKAFEAHYKQTEGQVKRLEKVFAEIDTKVQGKTCPAIIGIIDEGKEILEDYDESPALDAGLLASAQAVEHYEICRYGTLVTWASDLGYDGAVELLKENLAEEEETDELLNELAKGSINAAAMQEAAE